MDGEDGVVFTKLPAAVDDLLGASLELRVAPLHGIKIERCSVRACGHAGGGAAAHANAQPRPAELNKERARRQRILVRQPRVDTAHAARDHDGLVVAPARAPGSLLERAKIAAEIRSAELVVERRCTQRAIDHDVEWARDAIRCAMAVGFPGAPRLGELQMGYRKPRQACLGLGATTRCAFVADFATRASRRPLERLDGRRVVVGFDLHDGVHQPLLGGVDRRRTPGGVGCMEPNRITALHDRRVV